MPIAAPLPKKFMNVNGVLPLDFNRLNLRGSALFSWSLALKSPALRITAEERKPEYLSESMIGQNTQLPDHAGQQIPLEDSPTHQLTNFPLPLA
jgi:hypothetical protein